MPERVKHYIRAKPHRYGPSSPPEDREWAKTKLEWPEVSKSDPPWDVDAAVTDFKNKHKNGFFQ